MNTFYKDEKEIKDWLNSHQIANYHLIPCDKYGFQVNVEGDTNLSHKKLTIIPVKFNEVDGNFSCDNNKLISLEFSPLTVKGSFTANYNRLTSLEFCPNHIEGIFDCSYNQIKSLKYFPSFVKYATYLEGNERLSSSVKEENVFQKLYTEHLMTLENLNHIKTIYNLMIDIKAESRQGVKYVSHLIVDWLDEHEVFPPSSKREKDGLIDMLAKIRNEKDVVPILSQFFKRATNEEYLSFVTDFYHHPIVEKNQTKHIFHYAPIKYYCTRENSDTCFIKTILKNSAAAQHTNLLKLIIDNDDKKIDFYDFKKPVPDWLIKHIFIYENNIEIMDFFKNDIKKLFDEKKIIGHEMNKIFYKQSIEKLDYVVDNFTNKKEEIINILDCAFIALTGANQDKMYTHHVVKKLLDKDEKEKILPLDAFLLMTKRMVHSGMGPNLIELFKHIKENHDFYEEFKNKAFSGQEIEVQGLKLIKINLSNPDIQRQLKLCFTSLLDEDLIEQNKKTRKMKI